MMLPSQRKMKRKKPVVMAKKALKARRLRCGESEFWSSCMAGIIASGNNL
jgi:hypothetical protein